MSKPLRPNVIIVENKMSEKTDQKNSNDENIATFYNM